MILFPVKCGYSSVIKYKIYVSFGGYDVIYGSHSIRNPFWCKESDAIAPKKHRIDSNF